MKALDRFIRLISWGTLGALVALIVLKKTCALQIPAWLEVWALPVLTAAAVGYLTNWIAIWLLFKPYRKHWGFVQGVIPRNRDRLGRELGAIIPEYLLRPDELADQIGSVVRDYLQTPGLIDSLRAKVNLFLRRYSQTIAAFLIPYIKGAIVQAVRENLTPERLCACYDSVAVRWFAKEANRNMLASGIITELKGRSSEITQLIRVQFRDGAGEYMRKEHPHLSRFFNADEWAGKMVDSFRWDQVQAQITDKLGNEDTQHAIAAELMNLTLKLQQRLRAPDAAERLQTFLEEHRGQAEDFVLDYLAENIPGMVDEWLSKDELWHVVEAQLLPLIQAYILHQLKHEKDHIIRKFDIPGKIEQSVAAMDMQRMHQMILRAADNHLTAIQVLGYGLGAIAGLLLIFAR